jgi:hypothetical protein
VDVGGSWPWPKRWGFPKAIPEAATLDNEAAGRFMAEWARYQIRKEQRAKQPTTGAQALLQLRVRELRARLAELEAHR